MARFSLLKAGALAILVGLPATGVPALAHASLVSTAPAASGKVGVPSPSELRLGFSAPLELAFTKVMVKGPDGQVIALGKLALDPADAKSLVVPLGAALPAGSISVEWTAVATDGHKTTGNYTFDVQN